MNLSKTEKITGIILAVALALLTLAGSGYFLLHPQSELRAMARLQRLFAKQHSVFVLLCRFLGEAATCTDCRCSLADVLFRYDGTVYLYLERRQRLCTDVAYYDDA